jgi:hypothetical protein
MIATGGAANYEWHFFATLCFGFGLAKGLENDSESVLLAASKHLFCEQKIDFGFAHVIGGWAVLKQLC